jgi:hypothetical protein
MFFIIPVSRVITDTVISRADADVCAQTGTLYNFGFSSVYLSTHPRKRYEKKE